MCYNYKAKNLSLTLIKKVSCDLYEEHIFPQSPLVWLKMRKTDGEDWDPNPTYE